MQATDDVLIDALADRQQQLGERWEDWQVCYLAALEETKAPELAVALADEALQEMGENPVAMSLISEDEVRRSLAERIQAAADATDPDPTPAQKASGTYRKGKVTIQGLPITFETPKGATRSGVGADGKPWAVTMQ